jgi:hypothetical protein
MASDLAVPVEDKPGVLAGMGEAIGGAGINIGGVCGAAAGAGSVVHLPLEDAAATRTALESAGFDAIDEREVLVVDIEDRPGALGEAARKLADAGVNIELVYLASGTRLVIGAADLDAVRAAR